MLSCGVSFSIRGVVSLRQAGLEAADSTGLEPGLQADLEGLFQELSGNLGTLVGYPCAGVFDYSDLYRFLSLSLNNVGDPYAPSTYRMNTKRVECEAIAWFANLTHADPGSFWGYVTNGGSEGNLYGLCLHRQAGEAMVAISMDRTEEGMKLIEDLLVARTTG